MVKRRRSEVNTDNENIEEVGINDRVEEVKMLLQMEVHEEKGIAVILHGFGGMGKTTLASNVVNSLKPSSAQFLYAWVKVDSKKQDFETQVKDLQSELISQLKGSKCEVRDILAGQQELKTHFRSHSCFICVDNVGDSRQLDGLFPRKIPTNQTLRILVTSTDVEVRKHIPFYRKHIKEYHIDGLPDKPSLVLLKESVGVSDKIEQFRGETQKLEQVAKLCYGIPLLLIEVGKYLKFHRNEYYYNETLKRLEEADFSPYKSERLDDFLLCIFDPLDIDVQTAFLDICVFFVGKFKWEEVCHIVGQKAMDTLEERSIIRKEDNGSFKTVMVHDVLKAMALKFTKDQKSRFFITIDPDKIGSESVKLSDLLEECVDATKIEGLFIRNLHTGSKIHVQLGNLPSLRIFDSGLGISVEFKEEKVRSFKFENLYYFSMWQGRQRDIVELLLKERKPLKVLTLYFCDDVEEFPSNLEMIEQLRVLELHGWTMLRRVSSGIQHLKCLEVLDLSFAESIESLPEELGQLDSLKRLILVACEKLKALPRTISNLSGLIYLDMSGCESIVSLPDDMWKLKYLKRLKLRGCSELQGLPSQLEGLASLKYLDLHWCKEIDGLPDQLGQLHALEKLDLAKCGSLQCLPQSISKLQSLKVLNMRGCESITRLPKGICKLVSLKKLDLTRCSNLQYPERLSRWMANLKDFRK